MVKYCYLDDGVLDTETSTFIPLTATTHRFYKAYQEWLDEGNTPDPDPRLTANSQE